MSLRTAHLIRKKYLQQVLNRNIQKSSNKDATILKMCWVNPALSKDSAVRRTNFFNKKFGLNFVK